MVVRFTVMSDIAVTTCVPINNKGADLLISGIFEPKQSFLYAMRLENYF